LDHAKRAGLDLFCDFRTALTDQLTYGRQPCSLAQHKSGHTDGVGPQPRDYSSGSASGQFAKRP
jgi:hypothetical protein